MSWANVQAWMADARSLPWSELKSWIELVLWALALVAVFWCLARLKMIHSIILAFRESRGPLFDLKSTVTDLKEIEPKLRDLTEQMAQVKETVSALRGQLAALQLESISNRTGAEAAQVAGVGHPPDSIQSENEDDEQEARWEKLREFWKRNTQRIEYTIEQIPDGRKRLSVDRLPRTNYVRIVHKLQGLGLVSAAAANASKALIDLFNTYRPRNKEIPAEVVESLAVLDVQLDRELVPYATVMAAEDAEDESVPQAATNRAAVNRPSAENRTVQ